MNMFLFRSQPGIIEKRKSFLIGILFLALCFVLSPVSPAHAVNCYECHGGTADAYYQKAALPHHSYYDNPPDYYYDPNDPTNPYHKYNPFYPSKPGGSCGDCHYVYQDCVTLPSVQVYGAGCGDCHSFGKCDTGVWEVPRPACQNQTPTLGAIGDKVGTEGVLLTFVVTGSDPDAGQTLTFSACNLPAGATFDPVTRTFSWTPGSDQAGVYQNVAFLVQDNGDPVRVDREFITVTIGEAYPPPVAGFTGSPTTGVAPLTVNFTDASTGAVTGWFWDFGDGGSSALSNPSHTYANPGTYTVSLTASGPGGADTETKTGYITATLPPNTVTITAVDGTASETGTDTGTFRIERAGSTIFPLTVNYIISGTAANGADYNALSGLAEIPAGSSSVDIVVTPINDSGWEPPETVIITLASGTYDIGSPDSATVTIADNDPDTSPPTGTIEINGGAAYTNVRAVTLTLSATDNVGVTQMRFSNNGTSWGSWVAYAATRSYTLPTVDGSKTVYVQFRDAAGNWQLPYTAQDDITLDMTKPVTTASPPGGTYRGSVTVYLTATDNLSGPDKTYYTTDGSTPTTSSPVYTGPITITVTTTLKFRSTDRAGNLEAVKTQTYTIDTIAPWDPMITINGGATYTKSRTVTLTLSAQDNIKVTQMRFSNDNVTWGTPVTYATSRSYTLPSGNGTKTVYAQFGDKAGNWSATASDSIILDVTAPVTTASPANGTYPAPLTVTFTATDNLSGVDKIYYTTDGTDPSTSSLSVTNGGQITLSVSTTLKYRATDLAGNLEAVKSKTYTITP